MPTVEKYLSNRFGLTFLDARRITNEAKISLQIEGYPNPEQVEDIRNAAVQIFRLQPSDVQDTMMLSRRNLDTVKRNQLVDLSGSNRSSVSSDTHLDQGSLHSCDSSIVSSQQRATHRKRFSFLR
jgi:hypothetical protein